MGYNTILQIASRDQANGVAEKALALYESIPLKMRDAYTSPPVLHILANGRKPSEAKPMKVFQEARQNLPSCPNERQKLQTLWNSDAKSNPDGYVPAKNIQKPTSSAEVKFDSRTSARQARCPRNGWAVLPNRVYSAC